MERAWLQQRRFVADASHELKTPLTVILANNNILLSHPEERVETQKQWLESTGEEAQHMRRLVDDLLFLAKSDAGERPPVREPVAVSYTHLICRKPMSCTRLWNRIWRFSWRTAVCGWKISTR